MGVYHNRCDPGFAGRTPASGAGPLYRESTFRATPADRAREQALLDRQAARDRTAMRLYIGLACLTLAGLVVSILWYFGIIQRWYATYTGCSWGVSSDLATMEPSIVG